STLPCFFFPSGRRHTRFSRDWSSDVCSSDLTFVRQQVGNVAGRNRAVELAGLSCRAHHHEALSVEQFGDLLSFALALEVACLELRALGFELLLVCFVGAQRLALRQQEVTGKAVLDPDDVAHLAKAGNAFEKNDFHRFVLSEPQAKDRKQSGFVTWVAVLPGGS